MSKPYWSLDEMAQHLHREFNKKFDGRTIPSESVSEDFITRVVRSILEEFHDRGHLPFIPEFQVMNQSSLNDHFEGNVPDFSKHVNLIGLSEDGPPTEPGIMNIAIDGEDARQLEQQANETPDTQSSASPKDQPSHEEPDQPAPEPPEDMDPEDARQNLRVIKGGKAPD